MIINTAYLNDRIGRLRKPKYEGDTVQIPIESAWNEHLTFVEMEQLEPTDTRFHMLTLVANKYHKDGVKYLQWDISISI